MTIEEIFGINHAPSMVFGGITCDINPKHGPEEGGPKRTPYDALKFWSQMNIVLRKDPSALIDSWDNGFTTPTAALSLYDKKLVSKETADFFKANFRINTGGAFKLKREKELNTLFYHYSWYGSEDPITEDYDADTKNKYHKNNIVLSEWETSRPSIKYMVRVKSKGDEADYLYFIATQSSSIYDIEKTLPEVSKTLYNEIRSGNKKFLGNMWVSTNNVYVCILRYMYYIINVRNQLVYLRDFAEIENILEIDVKKDKSVINIDIDKVINDLELPYQWCVNNVLLNNKIKNI